MFVPFGVTGKYIATCLVHCVLLFVFSELGMAQEVIIDFEAAELGKPVPNWSHQGAYFELAHAPTKSKAIGRVSFFPHLGTGHQGIVNAMANEAIPIRVRFEKPAEKILLKLWGSTTSSAYVEAFDHDGKRIAKNAVDRVPVRKTPEEFVPIFELTVEAPSISHIEVGGSKPGGFLAIDELRWLPKKD